jgi:hypothetical protein
MLRTADIIHSGLQSLYQDGFTVPPPPSSEHSLCYRRLNALNAFRSATLSPHTFCGLDFVAASSGYEFLLSSGRITFGWSAGYATSVNWS